MNKQISKKAIDAIISELTEGCQIFAPVVQDGIKLYKQIESPEQINWGHGNCHRSLKELFFPITEPVFSFRQTRKGIQIETPGNHNKKRVVIGARPCDCNALSITDKVFKWDYEDELYLSFRENTLIIGVSCIQPEPFCFCTALNLSPFDETGSDILLTETGKGIYHANIITEKGVALFERFKEHFTEASPDQSARKDAMLKDIVSKMPAPFPMQDIKTWLDKNFDHPVWEEIALGCIGCGTCTYLCPTCHCFDITDESRGYAGERLRNWDSCAFGHFTQMPAHQPRPLQWQRFRQRVMHKFKYYIDRFSRLACVGCGRCRSLCPAGKDTVEVIQTLQKQIDLAETGPKTNKKG
ncbi:4Fe-4S dicluster domain-containing protein [bacterium]|nr:4Fe-4S dicluster domain-containing protein [bacterium]